MLHTGEVYWNDLKYSLLAATMIVLFVMGVSICLSKLLLSTQSTHIVYTSRGMLQVDGDELVDDMEGDIMNPSSNSEDEWAESLGAADAGGDFDNIALTSGRPKGLKKVSF